jgi:hypothetical protein
MTTDDDEVHGTVIDSGYPPEPESERPVEPADAPAEDPSTLYPAEYPADDERPAGNAEDSAGTTEDGGATDLSPADSDAEDAEDAEGDEDEDEEEEEEDDDGGVIVVESSSVVGEDETPGVADDEADEAAGPDVTGEEASAPGAVGEYEAAPDAASQGDAVQDPDAAPDTVSGLDAARGAVTPAHAAPAPAHSRAAGGSQFAGDAGLAGDADEMYRKWATIQSGFVDDPRESVADAAAFLSEVMTTVVANAGQREQELRDEWDRDTGLDTEALRIVLRRYRGLIDRLASL